MGRKPKDPPTIHVIGKFSNLFLVRQIPMKYEDHRNHVLILQIKGISFPNTLVSLGAGINIMTLKAHSFIGMHETKLNPTVLELANRSVFEAVGILENIIVSMDSWDFPANFLVLNIKDKLEAHPLMLRIPWLSIANGYIWC